MMDPFLGEIRMMSFSFAPKGWAFCNGSILQMNQNMALFSLISNMYGGDGQHTFGLPDLRGRTPLAVNNAGNELLASKGGLESVTLTTAQVPVHNHSMTATTQNGDTRFGNSTILATVAASTGTPVSIYAPLSSSTPVGLNAGSIVNTGGGSPHPNMQPFLVTNFCIALSGIFPPRN